jgi:hypothetical protein
MTVIKLVSLNTGKKQREDLARDLSTTGLTPGVVLNVAENIAKRLLLPCSGFFPTSLSQIGCFVLLDPFCKQNQIWKFYSVLSMTGENGMSRISYQRRFHAVAPVGAISLHNHHKPLLLMRL